MRSAKNWMPPKDLILTPDSFDFSEGVWWFGANSSRRLRASLHFANGDVRAENENGERRDARLSEVHIFPRLGNVPRKIVFADGTCIAADDCDRLDEAIRRHGGRQNTAMFRLEKTWTRAAVCVVLTAAGLWAFASQGLPALADFAAQRIPHEQTAKIGDEIYEQMKRQKIFAAADISPAVTERMEGIFARVAAALTEGEENFRLHLHDFFPNAFALPGGRVVVSASLAELLSDDELAAVFAHEIGHIRLRHGMRSVLLGSAGGLLAVLAGDISGVSLGIILLHLGYSRDHEREADCFAYAYLRDNGMSASLIGDALEKMTNSAAHDETDETDADETDASAEDEESDSRLFARLLAALSTHPQTAERKNLAAACDTN